ncbi:hypothetical protein K438DRAFT_1781710 [Mycena galopus ATCC 62051]|nr:hypothetical protein K438DRAFT_1781710 [Mycena galopus ATCC 62051]
MANYSFFLTLGCALTTGGSIRVLGSSTKLFVVSYPKGLCFAENATSKDLRELFWYIWLRPRRTSLTGVRGDAVLRGAEREQRVVPNCVEWLDMGAGILARRLLGCGNPLQYHRTAYKYAALYRLECLLPLENIILNAHVMLAASGINA